MPNAAACRARGPSCRGNSLSPTKSREGWQGWDDYARFYDWENARTLGRRDVPFWRRLARTIDGPILELGCGTGRVTVPLARAGVDIVGVDRSAAMLERAARQRLPLVRGDIRALPFPDASFSAVLAPYGILQSLIRQRDLTATLASVARVLPRGGVFGIDLVPDVANWQEYRDRRQFHGRDGAATITLFETVRRDPRRRLTTFAERFVVRRGGRTSEHRFSLVFRTLAMRDMTRLLKRAGFAITAMQGDYRRAAWHAGADVWIILAKKE